MFALGTRPADESHWFQAMLSGSGSDYAQCHAAAEDDPPFQRRTWLKANPSMPAMPALEKRIRKEAQDARKDPSLLAGFNALRLNLGIDDTLQTTLLDAATWRGVEGEADAAGEFVIGIDLGGTSSMTAAVAYWPGSTRLEGFGVYPELPDLRQRGLSDGVGRLYCDMHRRGELLLAGTRTPDIHAMLREVLTRWGAPSCIVADRWKLPELQDALDAVRFPRCPLVERGQGFKDGGEDVRDFRTATLRGRVTPVPSLLMRSAMGECRVAMDTAGNAKISKYGAGKRSRGRDDAAAAGVLAVAAGERRARIPQRAGGAYLGLA